MDSYTKHRNADTYPVELVLTINKAKTVSWRLGVAWTLVSNTGEVLVCNGSLFNQHNQSLISDLSKYSSAKILYISYCPVLDDLNSTALLDSLRLSSLVELHVQTDNKDTKLTTELSNLIAIPILHWSSGQYQSAQMTGIAWVRSTRQPWIHIVCSNSLGGGAFSLEKMSEQPGVLPYVTLKGIESSLLYVQKELSNSLGTPLKIADPQFVDTSELMIQCLNHYSDATVSVVTVVCDPSWLALLIQMKLANEVSYFLSLRSDINGTSIPPIVKFPESDHWIINSSEVMGDFMQVVLQKSRSFQSYTKPTGRVPLVL